MVREAEEDTKMYTDYFKINILRKRDQSTIIKIQIHYTLTFELDSLGRIVSKIVRFLLWASMSTKMTDQAAPYSPNKLHPLTASSAALAIPIEL